MSTYVDALERWDDQSSPAASDQRDSSIYRVSAPFAELADRLEAEGRKAIGFAGVSGHERAGDTALGYARSLVARGLRVLFVDLAPSAQDPPGLAVLETLLQGDDAMLAIVPAPENELTVVVSNPRLQTRPRAFELRVSQWLDVQAPVFDRVVVHVGAVLDDEPAVAFARWPGRAALVIRSHWTARDDIVDAKSRLAAAGVNVVGAVLAGARQVPSFLERALRSLGRG